MRLMQNTTCMAPQGYSLGKATYTMRAALHSSYINAGRRQPVEGVWYMSGPNREQCMLVHVGIQCTRGCAPHCGGAPERVRNQGVAIGGEPGVPDSSPDYGTKAAVPVQHGGCRLWPRAVRGMTWSGVDSTWSGRELGGYKAGHGAKKACGGALQHEMSACCWRRSSS